MFDTYVRTSYVRRFVDRGIYFDEVDADDAPHDENGGDGDFDDKTCLIRDHKSDGK